ncbi:putative reverse transcriptase domain-containing protein, partial [Tanacetum coccineum]
GDKTLPPGDVSSDSESKDEEIDVAPEATVGTVTQRPFAVRDFLRGILKSRENATLKKRLAETETKVVLEPVVLEPVVQEPVVLELVVPDRDCKERDKVKFATATLQDHALDWWNGRIASMGIDAANGTDIDGYTNRFHELALLCPRMVEPEQVKVEEYIHGLSKNIHKTDEASEGEKRKGEGDCGGRVCPKCKNKKYAGDCWKCGKCGKLGHKTAACWSLDRKDVTCFNCNEKGHRKRDCPKLKKNGQGGNNRGAVYKLGAVDAQQD